jgi:hypothetical protein
MKQIIIVFLTVCLFFSCQKKEEKQVPADETALAEFIPDEIIDVRHIGATGYALRINTSYYELENSTGNETDKTKWVDSMALGEKVTTGIARRATFAGDGKVYNFIEVRREDGREGLAFATQIAEGGNIAVVIDEKANLYKSPKPIDVTGTILSRKTIVVYYPETENDGYVEIKAYDPAAQTNRQNFIRMSSLSRKDIDVQSSILLQTALTLKNEGSEKNRRDALLDSALLYYPNSEFYAEIQTLVNPNTEVVIKTEKSSRYYMVVNDDRVNVRDLPDTITGKIIGQLNEDDEVVVSEQTSATYTIEGRSARWYHIMEPYNGWVFGIYLD